MKEIVMKEGLRSQFATSKLANSQIASKIVVVRDVQVLLDRDIAEMYDVLRTEPGDH